jgi:hypothetical protein
MTCQITNNSNLDISGFEDTIQQLVSFSQERFGFEKPPSLFLNSDPSNATNPLGKTAYYDPEKQEIHIYVDERHPKDIMRSISHELIHHVQNLRGDLSGNHYHGEGYAQKDKHMREMEREAYEEGNMCFRDFEDLKRENKTTYNEWRTNQMSLKEWKNKELFTLLSDKWGFGKNTITEAKDDEKPKDVLGLNKYLKSRGVSDEKIAKMSFKEKDKKAAMLRKRGGEDDVAQLEEDLEEEKKEHPLDVAPPHTGEPDAKDFAKLRKGKEAMDEEMTLDIDSEKNVPASEMEEISEEDDRDEELHHKDAAMDDFARMAKLHKDMVYDTYKKYEDELLGRKDDSERYGDAERDDAAHMDYLGKDAHDDHEAREDEMNEGMKEIDHDIRNMLDAGESVDDIIASVKEDHNIVISKDDIKVVDQDMKAAKNEQLKESVRKRFARLIR